MAAATAEASMGWNEDPAAAEPMDEGAAAAEDPMDQNGDAAAAAQPVQEAQVMEQDPPRDRELASHRQAAVTNRMDARPDQLVPYVSLSSSEDESSDSKGKLLKFLTLHYRIFLILVESDADTVILVEAEENNNGVNRDNEDDDGGDEGTLSEASLAEAKEMIIAEVRSLSVSTNRQIITID